MTDHPKTVLFLCTGNSCRSIMAEAILNEDGKPGFQAFSAGSTPTRQVHPEALACIARNGMTLEAPSSQSWDDYMDQPIDIVVTVCDNAAAEVCPVMPGQNIKIHWSIPDPASLTGTQEEIEAGFQAVFDDLHGRIEGLVAEYS